MQLFENKLMVLTLFLLAFFVVFKIMNVCNEQEDMEYTETPTLELPMVEDTTPVPQDNIDNIDNIVTPYSMPTDLTTTAAPLYSMPMDLTTGSPVSTTGAPVSTTGAPDTTTG